QYKCPDSMTGSKVGIISVPILTADCLSCLGHTGSSSTMPLPSFMDSCLKHSLPTDLQTSPNLQKLTGRCTLKQHVRLSILHCYQLPHPYEDHHTSGNTNVSKLRFNGSAGAQD
ncbi:hypothetical protein LSAT2_026984, partial [Lamellibrachia satsuma]